jgi:predicted TPR repeat methyltransferase
MTLLQPPTPRQLETSTAPYDRIAPHYEAFVGAEAHMPWVSGLLDLVADHGVRAGRALDVGCGTGVSLQTLVAAGFEARGCDPSPGMLREARTRVGEGVDLEVSALPAVPPGPPANLITVLNDVINYVAPADLDAAMASLAARLAPGGLLLFDANTPLAFARFFGATFCRAAGPCFFVWERLPRGADGAHRADLHTFLADPAGATGADRWTRSVSRHVQHHHADARVRAALAATGLELVDVQGQRDEGGRDATCDEAIHTKRIYLARRP